jgi:putative CRISPR-associated protein (TIGR02619 family)
MLCIVSTCGTSLLANDAPDEIRALLRDTANVIGDGLAPDRRAAAEAYVRERTGQLLGGDLSTVRRLSAELNGILGLYAEQGLGRPDPHDALVLVHSDTYQGGRATSAVHTWLEAQGVHPQAVRVPDLNTAKVDDFGVAMSWLVRWCAERLPGHRAAGYRVVFNVVGGFKSLQGFMQALGMFHADECH